MYFDYTGNNSCYRALSVAGQPNRNDRCREEDIRGFGPGGDRRSDRDDCGRCEDDRSDRNDCGYRPESDCCHSKDCCSEGTAAVLELAMRALRRNDTVDIEITLVGGYTQIITIGRSGSAIISGDLIRTPQGVLSVCEISKIRVIASSVNDPEYMNRLQNELEAFIQRCMRKDHRCDMSGDGCDSCVQSLQNYIMRNGDRIDTFIFGGSQASTAQVITDIESAEVVGSAELNTETAGVIGTAELESDTVEAVTAVTAAETQVVTSVGLIEAAVVSTVETESVDVSGPVDITPTEVVGAVELTEESDFAAGLSVASATVVGEITTETVEVISGFSDPVTVSGVLSGLESAEIVDTTAVNIPIISSGGTGALQVVVPAGAFGTNIPPSAVTLNVTIDGVGISYGGNDTVYVLDDDTTLLSAVAGDPTISEITTPGEAITAEVVSEVIPTPATVAESIDFTEVGGSLVTDVSTLTVGSVESAGTVSVISSVTAGSTDINTVDEVTTVEASELFNVDTAAVVSSVQFTTTTAEVLTEAQLVTSEETVISGVTTSPVSVSSPTFAEEVNGEIIGARCGIVAVDNNDGDISVYSSCDIKGTQTETDSQ